MKRLILVSLCVFIVAGTAWADDLAPPPWRGEWSTTTQWWEFGTDDQGPMPPDGPGLLDQGQGISGVPYAEQGGAPGYLPSTQLLVYPDGSWIDTDLDDSGRQGIWPLSGRIDVLVDNHEPPNPYKLVRLQLTWREQDFANPLDPLDFITNRLADGPDGPYAHDPVVVIYDQNLSYGWSFTTYEWYIYPNPVDEHFTIDGDIYVDQLVIDTWCIPEPTTIVLLGLGGSLLRRRKKA